jgi:transcriptional regulator with XRE-family HTH domain
VAFARLNGPFSMLDDGDSRGVQDLLAANLRRLRIARHLSLSELARATGVSKATLSGIENGHANPTVDTLAGLAAALRVPLSELLAELPLGEVKVVRAAQGPPEQRDGLPARLLDALGDGAEVSVISLGTREAHEVDALRTGSRACVYVLQGKLLAGPVERITELSAGDYASFPADVPHLYETRRHPARALLIAQGPE